jgi:hypothetical protein
MFGWARSDVERTNEWDCNSFGAQEGASRPTEDYMNIAGMLWNDY